MRPRGDLLVFLPGAGEIRRVQSQLADLAGPRLRVLPLYGELSAEEQDAALAESPAGVRRDRARDQHCRDQRDDPGRHRGRSTRAWRGARALTRSAA